jgi:hypothetical protein
MINNIKRKLYRLCNKYGAKCPVNTAHKDYYIDIKRSAIRCIIDNSVIMKIDQICSDHNINKNTVLEDYPNSSM